MARFLLAILSSVLVLSTPAKALLIQSITVSDITVYDANNDGVIEGSLFEFDVFVRPFGNTFRFQRGVWEYPLVGLPMGASINTASVLFENQPR